MIKVSDAVMQSN